MPKRRFLPPSQKKELSQSHVKKEHPSPKCTNITTPQQRIGPAPTSVYSKDVDIPVQVLTPVVSCKISSSSRPSPTEYRIMKSKSPKRNPLLAVVTAPVPVIETDGAHKDVYTFPEGQPSENNGLQVLTKRQLQAQKQKLEVMRMIQKTRLEFEGIRQRRQELKILISAQAKVVPSEKDRRNHRLLQEKTRRSSVLTPNNTSVAQNVSGHPKRGAQSTLLARGKTMSGRIQTRAKKPKRQIPSIQVVTAAPPNIVAEYKQKTIGPKQFKVPTGNIDSPEVVKLDSKISSVDVKNNKKSLGPNRGRAPRVVEHTDWFSAIDDGSLHNAED